MLLLGPPRLPPPPLRTPARSLPPEDPPHDNELAPGRALREFGRCRVIFPTRGEIRYRERVTYDAQLSCIYGGLCTIFTRMHLAGSCTSADSAQCADTVPRALDSCLTCTVPFKAMCSTQSIQEMSIYNVWSPRRREPARTSGGRPCRQSPGARPKRRDGGCYAVVPPSLPAGTLRDADR